MVVGAHDTGTCSNVTPGPRPTHSDGGGTRWWRRPPKEVPSTPLASWAEILTRGGDPAAHPLASG